MKTSKTRLISAALLFTGISTVSAGENPKPKFIKEGKWRGEFTVAESKVPFNFELKGKDAQHAVFTLINGSRRDHFHVQPLGNDSIYIKMNTYDAALVAAIKDDGSLSAALILI